MSIISILLAITLIALQVGDWWSTKRGVTAGTLAEGNPVMIWLIARIGLDRAFLSKGVFVALAALLLLLIPYGVFVLGILAAFYGWVVWHNCLLSRGGQ